MRFGITPISRRRLRSFKTQAFLASRAKKAEADADIDAALEQC